MNISGGRGCQAIGIASAKTRKGGRAFIFLSKSRETGVNYSRKYKRRSGKRCVRGKAHVGL